MFRLLYSCLPQWRIWQWQNRRVFIVWKLGMALYHTLNTRLICHCHIHHWGRQLYSSQNVCLMKFDQSIRIATSSPLVTRDYLQMKKIAHVFYTFVRSLRSFIVPYIELGAWLLGKFDLKRCNKVNNDSCFQVAPYRHCPLSAIRVVFFNLWSELPHGLFK